MQAMAWWSVPAVAFVIALVWVSLANRPRPPQDPVDSMAEHERFRQAMSRQIASPAPGTPAASPTSAAAAAPAGPDDDAGAQPRPA
jgi:hypothetical protein